MQWTHPRPMLAPVTTAVLPSKRGHCFVEEYEARFAAVDAPPPMTDS